MKDLIALFLMMIAAQLSAQSNFDLQGHRGCRGLLPENSIPAFIKAVELGVTTLELDVVITRDKKVVVSHEPWMSEVICLQPDGQPVPPNSMQQFNIYQMAYDTVKMYDCGSRFHPRFTQQMRQPVYKPLLSEVIDTVESFIRINHLPAVLYNIETKCQPLGDNVFHPEPAAFVDLVYEVLKEKNVLSKVSIQSFDVRTLQVMQKKDSAVPLVLLVENPLGLDANLEKLGFIPSVFSPFYLLVTPELVKAVHEKGMKIIPWTVNDQRDIGIILDMGVDGLITDYPDIAKSLLEWRSK
jgi:glycerophosphoryl diester phosphodiesterase